MLLNTNAQNTFKIVTTNLHISKKVHQGLLKRPQRKRLSCFTSYANSQKMWGGRFKNRTDNLMEKFNESISYDKKLCMISQGSKAYAKSLALANIINDSEAKCIIDGLSKIESEWKYDEFEIKEGDEDIHSANERRLIELIGVVGGKLHTGRSRNDQVSTDARLWLKKQVVEIKQLLNELLVILCTRADKEIEILMPGFTHLQPAQTIRWSQWLMAHAASLMRDDQRYSDMIPRIASLPLGSGAISGNAFGVDREFLCKELGFSSVSINSMDSVSDRDYVIEFVFVSSLLMAHLSRLAEDLIIYSSPFFGFVQCSDSYTTGSSLMPQKKNPDGLELLRGKTGKVFGNLMGALTTLKGTPLTYNKDFQEIWNFMYDTKDTVSDCLMITSGIIKTLVIFPEKMNAGLSYDMLATDLAEYLVRKGVPFRQTHEVAGKAVSLAEDLKCSLADLSILQLQELHPLFEDDVKHILNFIVSAESRDTDGGSSKRAVLKQIEIIRSYTEQSIKNKNL